MTSPQSPGASTPPGATRTEDPVSPWSAQRSARLTALSRHATRHSTLPVGGPDREHLVVQFAKAGAAVVENVLVPWVGERAGSPDDALSWLEVLWSAPVQSGDPNSIYVAVQQVQAGLWRSQATSATLQALAPWAWAAGYDPVDLPQMSDLTPHALRAQAALRGYEFPAEQDAS